MINNPQPIDWT